MNGYDPSDDACRRILERLDMMDRHLERLGAILRRIADNPPSEWAALGPLPPSPLQLPLLPTEEDRYGN